MAMATPTMTLLKLDDRNVNAPARPPTRAINRSSRLGALRLRISLPISRCRAERPIKQPTPTTQAAPTTSAASVWRSKRRSASASAMAIPTIGPNSIAISMAPMMTAGEFSISPKPAMNAAAPFMAR